MGFLSAIFGAKPPYGTPPFAPPHPSTGGAMVPPAPGEQQHGLSGFFDRLANPTNGLGQIGMALLAGSGGPLGGMAQVLMQQGEARRKARAPQLEHVGDSIGVVDPTTGKFTPTYTAPQKPQGPDDFTRQMTAAGIDPTSDEGKALYRQHVTSIADPITQVQLGGGAFATVPRSMMGQIPGMSSFGSSPAPLPSGTPPTGPIGKIVPVEEPPPAAGPPAGGTHAGGILSKNNPGALRIPGSMGFQRFSTPQAGISAQEGLLGRYMQRGRNSVSAIVEKYAPRQSVGGDNTDAQVNGYISYVSRRLGVNPADSLSPVMLPRLAEAMREFETGRRAD